MQSPETVVVVHGLWMTPRSWERWPSATAASGEAVVIEDLAKEWGSATWRAVARDRRALFTPRP
jgi:hypothetical protein